MPLEVLNNRTSNTHENEQFRRVVQELEKVFKHRNYTGLLIGNPFNELYPRFRADAILYYDNGIVLVDFKDYSGRIRLPNCDDEFATLKWFNESPIDRKRIEIKAGSRFINPFRQLKYYREAFYEVVSTCKDFNGIVDPSRVCIANIFSGPIKVENKIPGHLPYYKLLQESNIGDFLYDFAGHNPYNEEVASVLKKLFPAELWYRDTFELDEHIVQETSGEDTKLLDSDNEVHEIINSFLNDKNQRVLALESMQMNERDSWAKHICSQAIECSIPQVELWAPSKRISNRISARSEMQYMSAYAAIYGGQSRYVNRYSEENKTETTNDDTVEVIPLKSNECLDNEALIIVQEAHLVSRSLRTSHIRFGSGRLLEDISRFLHFKSKIVFIGDPYSLTYGKPENSALHQPLLSDLFGVEPMCYRSSIPKVYSDSRDRLSIELANSIETQTFNYLNYNFDGESLVEYNKDDIAKELYHWFKIPLEHPPLNAILHYKNEDCKLINMWIKTKCLRNDISVSPGDLLLLNNEVYIADENGLQTIQRLSKGMYLRVQEVGESKSFDYSNQCDIKLEFTRIVAVNLSGDTSKSFSCWILQNYLDSNGEESSSLNKAVNILENQIIQEHRRKNKFRDSGEYRQMIEDKSYLELSEKERNDVELLIDNYLLRKEDKQIVTTSQNTRRILGHYNKLFSDKIRKYVRFNNPFVNALHAAYGWAITVHKAMGMQFEHIILSGEHNKGETGDNPEYFRWLYTGICSASQSVKMINQQTIHPMKRCHFSIVSKCSEFVTKSDKRYTSILYPNYSSSSSYSEYVRDLNNENTIGVICEMSNLLADRQYYLCAIERKGEYLSKAHYSLDKDGDEIAFVIDIYNKGPKNGYAVSSIKLDKLNSGDRILVENVIDSFIQLYNESEVARTRIDGLDELFRKEVYRTWLEDFEINGIVLILSKSHLYHDFFQCYSKENQAQFKVHYTKDGFFTFVEIIQKTSDEFGEAIKKILQYEC